jgi:ABC-type sugar transport system substrate-binding protein
MTNQQATHIGLVLNDPSSPFWATLGFGAKERARQLGARLSLLSAQSSAAQARHIDHLVQQGVDALAVAPIDYDRDPALVASARAARQAGVQLITCEALGSQLAPCNVGSDLRAAAGLVTSELVRRLGGRGTIAHLAGDGSVPRSAGFQDIVARHPGVEVVYEACDEWTEAGGERMMRAALAAQPDLSAVFTHNDRLLLGVVAALEAAGLAGKVLVGGVDAQPQVLEAVHRGRICATASLSPRRIGWLVAETLLRAARGEALPPEVSSPVELITSENLVSVLFEDTRFLPDMVRDLIETSEAQQRLQQEMIAAQERALRELSTPIIPISDDILVLPLVGSLDERRAAEVMERALARVGAGRARILLVDITGVPVVDTTVAHRLVQMARAVELLGAQVILVGIAPEIAQTIVQLGVDLSTITTRSTLQVGLEYATATLRHS